MTRERGVFSSDGVHYTDVEYAAVTAEVLNSLHRLRAPRTAMEGAPVPASAPSAQPPPPPPPATPQMVPANAALAAVSSLACLVFLVVATTLAAAAERAAKAGHCD